MHKILLIEDDDIMSRMYKKLFTYKGYDINVAENGEEGFRKAKQFKPDLILLDVMMPKMNGFETLDKLKTEAKTKNIKVILLSNLGLQEELDKAIKKGAIKYVIKNENSPSEVLEIVNSFLRN